MATALDRQESLELQYLGQSFVERSGIEVENDSTMEEVNGDQENEVSKLILRETRKMVEYDDVPTAFMKKLLQSSTNSNQMEVEILDQDDEEYLRLEELKLSSFCLAKKVRIAQSLNLENEEDTQTVKSFKMSKSKKTYATYEKTMDRVKLNFWNSSLWKIQAKFGSTAASWFRFMRWMIALVFINTLFIFGLIFAPKIAYEADSAPDNSSTCPAQSNQTYNNVTYFPIENALECCSQFYENLTEKASLNEHSTFLDYVTPILTGSDWMENTYMFYGYYKGTYVFEFKSVMFDFPLAYFLVMVAIFLLNLTLVVFSSASSIKARIERSIDSESGFIGMFPMVFGSWDHKINDEKSVLIQRSDVFGKIRLTLSRLDRRREMEEQSVSEKRKIIGIRILINFIILVILGCVAYFIYWLTAIESPFLLNQECISETNEIEIDYTDINYLKCLSIEYLPSIFVTFSNLAIPFVFTKLINYEKYEANTKLSLNLFRSIFLRLASILVTLISLERKVNCDYSKCHFDSIDPGFTIRNCTEGADFTHQSCANENDQECSKPICWETYVGEQLYKLTIVDFIVQVGIVFLYDTPRTFLFGKCLENSENFQGLRNMLGTIHFDMTKHVLDIVYSMTICWMALYFAPLISLVTLIKFVVIFYLRLYFVNYICTPTSIPYTASRASEFFKICLILSLTICIGVMAYVISNVTPSNACGPFRDISCGNTTDCVVFDYVTYLIDNGDDGLKDVLFTIGQSSVLYITFFVVILIGYIFLSLSNADTNLAKELKIEVAYESKVHEQKSAELQRELRKLRHYFSTASAAASMENSSLDVMTLGSSNPN